MSDVQATTQTSVAAPMDTESHFQGLWDSGAFDPNGKRPDDSASTAQTDQQTRRTAAQDDPAAQTDQQASQTTDDAQTTQEDAPAYSSLDELLTSMKVDPESVRALPVTVKIDGVEKSVPLADVIKSYQLEGHVNNKSIELSNQKAQYEQERTAWQQATQQALQQHQAMGNLALQMLNHDFNRVDWNTLRAQNPAEFAALQAEFGQRQQQIQGFLQNVQQQAQHEAAQQQQTLQQSLAKEHEKLLSARPEWRDQAAFSKDREQMSQYARSVGFQDAELSQIFDHRYMLILSDAARYRQLQAAGPQALKQVRQAPVMAAPGSRTNVNPKDASRQAAIERFNRNPRDEDAQAAVFSMLTD